MQIYIDAPIGRHRRNIGGFQNKKYKYTRSPYDKIERRHEYTCKESFCGAIALCKALALSLLRFYEVVLSCKA